MVRAVRCDCLASRPLVGWVLVVAFLASACGSTSTESVTGPAPPKCAVSLTGPDAAIDAAGGSGAIAVDTQPECAWTASAEANWISDLTPAQGQGASQVQFRVASNPNGTARESAIAVNGQRAVIRQSAAPCQLDVAVSDNHFPAAGGAGTLTISAPAGCAWTASSAASWIAVSPLSGAGSGSVSLTVAVNTGAARTGTVTAAGVSITIVQDQAGTPTPSPCTISLQPVSTSMPAGGGSGTVAIAANAGCPWTASSLASWITLTSAASGSGAGTLAFNVAANSSSSGRIGSINIGGATFTINQAGTSGSSCSVSINPTSQSVPSGGATGVNVAVSTASGCAWTATSNVSWVTISSGSSGTGNGTVKLNIAANSGSARVGTVTIGGQTFTVNQAAAPCSYTINPTSQSIGASGGTGTSVSVSTSTGCTWTAASNASWLTITSGASGSGNGTVAFTVAANGGSSRTGTLTIAGQTFTVNQAAAACSYSINPTSITVGDREVSGLTVSVTAPSGCSWTATENAGWLDITSSKSGSGNGTVTYRTSNYNGSSRTGTLTIAGQTFTVTQVMCTATLNPPTQQVSALGGSFSVSMTTQIGCPWSVQEGLSWVTISSATSGTGSATVSYVVAPNVGGARSGNVSIAGQTLTINQAAVIP